MITEALRRGVALDLDGTICNTVKSLKNILISKGWSGFTDEYLKPNSDPQDRRVFIHGIPELQSFLDTTIQELFEQEEVYEQAEPLEGALEGALALHSAGLLKGYATRRPFLVSGATRRWLIKWGFPDLAVGHTYDHNKSGNLRFFKAGTIIEDSPHEVMALDIDHHALLITAHYNTRFPLPPNATRCNWETIQHVASRL